MLKMLILHKICLMQGTKSFFKDIKMSLKTKKYSRRVKRKRKVKSKKTSSEILFQKGDA